MENQKHSFPNLGHHILVVWNYFMFAGISWYGFSVPISLALVLDTPFWLHVVNVSLSVLFLVDIFIRLNTPIFLNNEMIADPVIIHKNYLKNHFIPDLLGTVPWDLLLMLVVSNTGGSSALIVLTRLLRLFRVPSIIANLRVRTGNALVDAIHMETDQKVKLLTLLFWVAIGLNAIACGWIMVSDQFIKDPVSTYIQAFYWLIVTVSTVGYGDITPQTDIARIYAIMVMLVGIAMYGYIIGSVSTTITNSNAQKQIRHEKFSALANFMNRYSIPLTIQNNIFSFYDHYLRERMTMADEILQELPQELRREIDKYVNLSMLRGVPFFTNASHECLVDMNHCLTTTICSPGETIIQAGDQGHEMYFLFHGEVEVLDPKGHLLVRLRAGSFFGEVALLRQVERVATVRATSFCDLYVLGRSDFNRVMESYPDFAKQLQEVVDARYPAVKKDS